MPDSMGASAERADLHVHAADDLRFIRDTMARASSFTAVPGWGGVFMGLSALVIAPIAGPPSDRPAWLAWWLLEAVVAILIGGVAMVRKARRYHVPLAGQAARRFWFAFTPGLAAGAILTAAFVQGGLTTRLPGCWLLLYGVSIASAGAFSVRPLRVMGLAFMALGFVAFLIPARGGDALLAAGFGLLHIAFGLLIARHYGG